jgi:hypothetical protein
MNRTRAFSAFFFTVRVVLLAFFGFGILGLPKPALAQSDITDDEIVDVTDEFCDPDEGDDCEVESVASILDSTTSTEIDTYYATFITVDLLDYDYYAYVEGYLYQDDVLIADGDAFDDGSGEAELDGATPINVSGGADAYAAEADSYLYDADYDEYDYILSTEADATLGPPDLTSVSPAYVYVGTNGTLTLGGDSLVNPFGACATSVSAVPASSGATGLTLTAGSFNPDQQSGTATYEATLTATTGPWDIGMGSCLGGTIYSVTTKGLFTVGDPTPSIISVSPSTWTAGSTNLSVTITGSGFGSNPQLAVSGAGVTASITSHSDNGESGGATIVASVTVPACADGTVTITVTSQGYNGSGFGAAYSGQSDSTTSTATIATVPGSPPGAPQIMFGGKNVAGTTTSVVVGQQISLTGQCPTQACTTVQSWKWTPPTGTAVGSYTASTAGGVTLGALPSTGSNPYAFYWVYAGTFTVSVQYTLTNGETSPSSTATFKVAGLTSGTDTATSPYSGKLAIDTLTGCSAQPGGPYLVYGNVSGPAPGCSGKTTGTAGILFTASGTQPGSGKYFFVQLLTTDTTTDTNSSGAKVVCTTTVGIDQSYPYAGQPTSTTATDAPEAPLPSTYVTVNRVFNATMYLMWQSSTANSIPVTIGYQSWQFNGTGTQSGGKWTPSGSGAPIGSFTTASASQANKGYPSWTGPATQSCN